MVELTRRSVASEEIQTAIDLVFTGGSLVTAHLVAWAAVDVLRGVANQAGVKTMHDMMEEHIRADKITFFRRAMRDHYTFSKHSDKDPDRVVDNFNPETTYLLLFAAVVDYGEIYKKLTLEMYFFRAWVLTKWPDMLNEGAAAVLMPGANLVFGESGDLEGASAHYQVLKENRARFLDNIPAEARATVEM